MKLKGYCLGCLQPVPPWDLTNGYCSPCLDELREMVDNHEVKPLDGDSYDDTQEENPC